MKLLPALLLVCATATAQFNFTLQTQDGPLDTREIQDSIMMVVFLSSECPCVEDYLTRLNWIAERVPHPIIGINSNQEKDMRLNVKMPYGADHSQEIAKRYGATRTPEIFVLRRSGDDWCVVYSGAIDDSPASPDRTTRFYVGEVLAQLYTGRYPNTERAEPLMGCGIPNLATAGCPMAQMREQVKALKRQDIENQRYYREGPVY